ncbi:hypothetical protein YC2023_094420 [Brassica napus]
MCINRYPVTRMKSQNTCKRPSFGEGAFWLPLGELRIGEIDLRLQNREDLKLLYFYYSIYLCSIYDIYDWSVVTQKEKRVLVAEYMMPNDTLSKHLFHCKRFHFPEDLLFTT